MYVRLYVCMHVCMYVCMYVCMHVCMYVYVNTSSQIFLKILFCDEDIILRDTLHSSPRVVRVNGGSEDG